MTASATYDARVLHRRAEPEHTVAQRLRLAYLDLDELAAGVRPEVLAASVGRTTATGAIGPSRDVISEVVVEHHGRPPAGPIRMLTQLRTLGWLFNPITTYYCFEADGATLDAVVLEVTNTPWHERHWYVLDGREQPAELAKAFHVSPFLPMDLTYRCTAPAPDDQLALTLDLHDPDGHVVLAVALEGRRIAGDGTGTGLRGRLQTLRVSAAIYVHALVLRARGARFHRHPRAAAEPAAPARTGPR